MPKLYLYVYSAQNHKGEPREYYIYAPSREVADRMFDEQTGQVAELLRREPW